ncbi:SagB/ThcOx family dehydrogenase [Streptomyces roseoverticillatus]|uniref:SagB/ThcOx family dehydrogenase n=1 Tax=Streptomyces roseoverticillatus TaxID=66429 RepID=UPI001F23DE4E|nr:SagB/ThcOx family dehydrogenase [Streptomyces roseoverticillatus]MCF3106788.1 SagB/ThcOx family dehydrogenase [Streptomyces roseoverticillatus]
MTDLLTATVEAAVTGQGYGVRPLPLPLYVRAHAAALVPAGHAEERLDLSAADIPVLDVAVAAGHAEAVRELAASAARLKLARAGENAAAGAGADRDEAVARAVYDELARRRSRTGPRTGVRITGCEPAETALRGTTVRFTCHLLDEPEDEHGLRGIPAVHAVLRLDRLDRPLSALVCDLDPRRGVRRAVHAVLRAFLLETWSADRTDAAPEPEADTTEPPGTTGEIAYTDLAAGPAPGTETGLLRAALRRNGLRARARTLSPPGAGLTVAACRITAAAPDAADARDEPAVSVPPSGLRAPRQLSLTYTPDDVRLSRLFHEHSKMRTAFGTLPAVDISGMAPAARRLIGGAYRDFRDSARAYDLATDRPPVLAPLEDCVRKRRSWAPMDDAPLTREQLAHLLKLVYGTTGSGLAGDDIRLPLRATPSAGGLYSCDLFLLVDRVTGIEPGLYYLHPGRRELQLVRADRSWADVTAQTGYRDRARGAAAMVVYTGAFRRNQWKYRERGYRTVLLDCGHLAQSVVLTATALGLVAHPMIAFVDDYFNDLVGVDGVDDAVLYLTLLGTRATAPARPGPDHRATGPEEAA